MIGLGFLSIIPRSVWIGLGAATALGLATWYVHHDGYKDGIARGDQKIADMAKAAWTAHKWSQDVIDVFTKDANGSLQAKLDKVLASYAQLKNTKPPGKIIMAECRADAERTQWANATR